MMFANPDTTREEGQTTSERPDLIRSFTRSGPTSVVVFPRNVHRRDLSRVRYGRIPDELVPCDLAQESRLGSVVVEVAEVGGVGRVVEATLDPCQGWVRFATACIPIGVVVRQEGDGEGGGVELLFAPNGRKPYPL